MDTKENGALYAALANAQAEMKNATLNKVNPHFKSKYADLPTIRDATIPTLAKHGLCITQFTRVHDNSLLLVTRLSHGSGEYLEGEYPLPYQVDKPQAMGSAMTYARRYGLAAICGIAADEDDDANAAEDEGKRGASSQEQPTKNPPGITKFREETRYFYSELYACTEYDQYVAFVNSVPVKTFLARAQKEFPNDWLGDGGDVKGIKESMAAFCDSLKKYNELRGQKQ
jgi:ERF superfamily